MLFAAGVVIWRRRRRRRRRRWGARRGAGVARRRRRQGGGARRARAVAAKTLWVRAAVQITATSSSSLANIVSACTATDPNPESSGAGFINPSVANVPMFAQMADTNEGYMVQEWYHCLTCIEANKLDAGGHGLCEPCAITCHKGHSLRYARSTFFKCDCGVDYGAVERFVGETMGHSAGSCCRLKGGSTRSAVRSPPRVKRQALRLQWGPFKEEGHVAGDGAAALPLWHVDRAEDLEAVAAAVAALAARGHHLLGCDVIQAMFDESATGRLEWYGVLAFAKKDIHDGAQSHGLDPAACERGKQQVYDVCNPYSASRAPVRGVLSERGLPEAPAAFLAAHYMCTVGCNSTLYEGAPDALLRAAGPVACGATANVGDLELVCVLLARLVCERFEKLAVLGGGGGGGGAAGAGGGGELTTLCHACGRGARRGTMCTKLLRCAKCKSAMYCSAWCQKYAWRHLGHKEECKKTPAAAAAAAEATTP
jgi:hypothetical protein